MDEPPAPWWRDAVIYQVYLRSFADGDGDGLGDLAGLRARLPYLRDLGVDALWINPWYVSPQADAGYDVEDYRAIDPRFGTLADAEALVAEAHVLGLRVIADLVPNHTSDRHAWFRAARDGGPGAPERDHYVIRPGRGPDGDEPPTNWRSMFGGPAWSRLTEPDGSPGPWYLHLFAPEQPDLDWSDPAVATEFEAILRFWFDRGIDGFRIDVAHGLVKDPELPDLTDPGDRTADTAAPGTHPYWDRGGVHAIYRSWRAVADEYPGDRTFVAEAWTSGPGRLARYVRPGELQTAFNFDFLLAPWDAWAVRDVVDTTTASLRAVGAPATWVLSNHDVVRHPSRYGRRDDGTVDLVLGRRRARAALLLEAALPGGFYVYQGEELGLEEVEDLPDEARQDPTWERSGHTERGRDGARVPLPWAGDAPPFGFVPDGSGATPWLPQPTTWAERTVERESGDPDSMLALYRAVLARRREHPALGDGPAAPGGGESAPVGLTWRSAPDDEVLVFGREPGFVCAVNLSTSTVPLPAHERVLLASGPHDDGVLPPDTAVWLEVGPPPP